MSGWNQAVNHEEETRQMQEVKLTHNKTQLPKTEKGTRRDSETHLVKLRGKHWRDGLNVYSLQISDVTNEI